MKNISFNKVAVSALCCISVSAALLLFGGCARNISSGAHDSSTLGEAEQILDGTVESLAVVDVNEGERLEDNKTGALMGAAGGAAIGNLVGGGRGKTASTVLGALAGGVGGAMAERSMKSQTGLRYVVRLDRGGKLSVVQGTDNRCSVGQRVYVHISSRGRSRVTPM